MILYAYLLAVGGAVGMALVRWRWGLLLMIPIGLLQDAVRKLTPGAPGYLLLPAGAVWLASVVGAFACGDVSWANFRRMYRTLSAAILLFALLIIPATIRSAMYGPGSWRITLIGLFIYGSLLVGMMIGTQYPRQTGDLPRLLGWYCACAAVLVSGGVFERLGIDLPALGTRALDYVWITYRTGGAVRMYAGFFRGPDIHGWHSATLVMLALALAVCTRGWKARGVWLTLAAWGAAAVLVCARRKMVAMVPVFAIAFAVLTILHGRGRRLGLMLTLLFAIGASGFQAYRTYVSDEYIDEFYLSTLDTARDDVVRHGWNALAVTYRQAGFLGYGVGMATQGIQHIQADRPRAWQEGGLGKLLAELGVPGLIGFIFMLALLGRALILDIRQASLSPQYPLYAGLAALLIANASAAVVSAQIYGDPFLAALMSFFIGLTLSAARVAPNLTPAQRPDWRPVPADARPDEPQRAGTAPT